ncbi:MAG: glycine cleavage system protein GcvH [SAR202 cluster bacterium]|nr:glycine cleavage system protein GcvH [SAR202 cluster bacterium]
MADNPRDRRYSREHEWALPQPDGTVLIGITDFAQHELGDVVFVDLPDVGARLAQFEKMGEIESVKSVSDLFSPLTGEVVAQNTDAIDGPELVNQDPYYKAWLIRLRPANTKELDALLTAEQYEAFVAAEEAKKEKK